MPYLQLNTTVRLDDAEKHSLCEEIGEIMPLIPGKTRDNTMMNIVDGCFIEKGANGNPCLNLEVRVLGAVGDEQKNDFIVKISEFFEKKLNIRQDFMYINIVEFFDWGSGGKFIKVKKD